MVQIVPVFLCVLQEELAGQDEWMSGMKMVVERIKAPICQAGNGSIWSSIVSGKAVIGSSDAIAIRSPVQLEVGETGSGSIEGSAWFRAGEDYRG